MYFVYNLIKAEGSRMQAMELLASGNHSLAAKILCDAWIDQLTEGATAVTGCLVIDGSDGKVFYSRERKQPD